MTTFLTLPLDQERRLADTGKRALFVHGSAYSHPYVFGSCRGRGSDATAAIVRLRFDDYTSYDVVSKASIPNPVTGTVPNPINFNAVCVCRGKLWYAVYDSGINRVYGIDAGTLAVTYNDYTWSLTATIGAAEVTMTDGDFVYFSGGNRSIHKFDPDTLALTGVDYTSHLPTRAHSGVVDGTHIYLSAPTSSATAGKLIKVLKSNLSFVASVDIPQLTDDMTQNADFIFGGIEVGTNSTWPGYNKGCIAIRKSDLAIFYLPLLGASDTTSFVSYSSLVFGKWLVDMKTNDKMYIIDLEAGGGPANWTTGSTVSSIVAYEISFNMTSLGSALVNNPPATGGAPKIPNELLVDINGALQMFCWTASVNTTSADVEATNDLTSGIIRVTPPNSIFATPPSVATVGAVMVGQTATLSGDITAFGGSPILEAGFYRGFTSPPTNRIVESGVSGAGVYTQARLLAAGHWYAQAFAKNALGESVGSIIEFDVVATVISSAAILAGD